LGAAELYGRRSGRQLIDWRFAVGVALRTCGTIPPLGAAEREALEQRYRLVLEQIEEPIARFSRTHLPLQGTEVRVLDRPSWIRTNADNFRELLQPFEDFYQEQARREPVGAAMSGMSRLALSSQLGVLLGYLSRRVLGQYDLALLGREPVTTGRLYFVEPNIRQLEARLGLVPTDFRLWIALHETTHAYEFEAHPWLRDHMNGLLRRYFDALGEDLGNLRSDLRGLGNFARRIGGNLGQKGYAVELVMTPEQRAIFRALQALMCLLEGYSNHVMDAVGRDLLPSYGQMKERFESRLKRKGPAERLFAKLTGLDVKMEQYQLGERFVNTVVERVGVAGMNRVWLGPDALPTLEEVREPRLWIERVAP
jgi:coenzyme F420 biosynthesis associated uncharacterized protein